MKNGDIITPTKQNRYLMRTSATTGAKNMSNPKITVTLSNGHEVTVNQVTNDANGNPRYVIHYLDIANSYSDALNLIRKIGGKMYTAKWYGGGLVFSTYTLEKTLEELLAHAGKL